MTPTRGTALALLSDVASRRSLAGAGPDATARSERRAPKLSWVATFLVASTLAADLGHGGIARAVTGIAEIPLFVPLAALLGAPVVGPGRSRS